MGEEAEFGDESVYCDCRLIFKSVHNSLKQRNQNLSSAINICRLLKPELEQRERLAL